MSALRNFVPRTTPDFFALAFTDEARHFDRSMGSRWTTWLVPAALWLWLFQHLHYEWTLNPQYNYGWAVPFFAAYLFYNRWRTRPAPTEPPRRAATAAAAIGWCGLALLLPLRVVEEANPDWRLLSWVFALTVVAFTLSVIFRVGGQRWLTHFAWPICLPLVAVPWLVQGENLIVQGMTRAVASAAAEIASWLNISAYQMGNVIELANGFVGVDEACSGVKTLQGAIMISLFLGELLLLPAGRRAALFFFGCAWVFACNVLRASTLVVIAARDGIPALAHWHDFVGWVVIGLGMGGLTLVALGLSKGRMALPVSAPGGKAGRRISLPETVSALAWLALIFAGTELWYRAAERNLISQPAWTVRWPQSGTQILAIPDATAAILHYNQATSATWEQPAAVSWWGFYARWEPQRAALQLVRSHSPDICLPAVGRKFMGELAPERVEDGALQLAFRTYQFEQNGQPLFVFVCVKEDKTARGGPPPLEWNAIGRLRAAWRGQRNLGQRLLELAVSGIDGEEQARSAVRETVRAVVRPAPTTG